MSSLPTHVPRVRTPTLPPPATSEWSVEVRDNLSLAAADAAAFDRLIDAHPHVAVFMSRAWLSGFFVEPPPDWHPALIVFREHGVLRGIVPIARRRRNTHTRVSLLGGGAG